jgi:hypothetical protein
MRKSYACLYFMQQFRLAIRLDVLLQAIFAETRVLEKRHITRLGYALSSSSLLASARRPLAIRGAFLAASASAN